MTYKSISYPAYFRGMIGMIIELALSWALLRLVERRGLSVLGLQPSRRKILVFAGGLLVPLVVEGAFRLLEAGLLARRHP